MSFFKKAFDNIKKTANKATDKAKDLVQKKDKNVEEMEQIAAGLKLSATNRLRYSQKFNQWGQSLKELCTNQNPDVSSKMDAIVDGCKRVSEIEEKRSKEEDRNAEDYRDILERFRAILNKNHKYIDAKQAYKNAGQKLSEAQAKDAAEQAKPTYEKNRFKLQQNIESCKEKKRQKLEELKDTLRDLIEHRERYNKFKVRRLNDGWTRYGNSIQETCDEEVEALEQLQEAVRELRDSGDYAPPAQPAADSDDAPAQEPEDD